MRATFSFLCMFLVVIISTACNNQKEALPFQDKVIQGNERYVYNVSKQQMGIYNEEKSHWIPLYEEENVFQYVFNQDSEYVVSGHSTNNQFVLLKLNEDRKELNQIFDLNNNQDCFFPLASDGKQFYYVLYEDERNTEIIKRSIVTFDEKNQMKIIRTTHDLITSGVIIDQFLYYTVYDRDQKYYAVYSIDLNDGEKEPKLIKTNLETRELYKMGHELLFSSRDKIFNDKRSFEKKEDNFFVDHYLIQMGAEPGNGLVGTVTNTESKKVIHTFKNPINFELNGEVLKFYCEGQIYKIHI